MGPESIPFVCIQFHRAVRFKEIELQRVADFDKPYGTTLSRLLAESNSRRKAGSAIASARFITSEFDRQDSSDTYWSYQRALAHSALLPALSRGIH